jgi:hypothetical protein
MNLSDPQLGLLSHLAAVSLLYTALLIPPSTLSHTKLALAFLPPIWGCHIYSWSVGLGFLAAIQVLWATDLLLFRNPREKFSAIQYQPFSPSLKAKVHAFERPQKREEDKKEQPSAWKEPYPDRLGNRFSWIFKLLVSMRYIGWDISDSSNEIFSILH